MLATIAAALGAAPGCRGVQSTLEPHGPAADAIAQSAWIMAAGGAAILALVMALALYAVYRDPDKRRAPSSTAIIAGGGLVFPAVVLTALLAYGVALSDRLHGAAAGALELEVVAHQWWWEIRYPGAAPGEPAVATANELRLPAGRPVTITLTSADVIHSFWVPSLAGKVDAIPGRVTRLTLRAERPGRFRGQCAEFCGAQHARMALDVEALSAEDFERWLARLRQPADAPPPAAAGLFERHCAECHVVRGVTREQPRQAAPDLTHLASRPWLGAGALDNTPANLERWIAANDAVKPGNLMPAFRDLEAGEIEALAGWLAGLR